MFYAIFLFAIGYLLGDFSLQRDDYRKRIALASASPAGFPEVRIIGGEDAAIEEHPFTVSLQNNGTFFGHDVEPFCAGAIISDRWIITSAQCALRIRLKSFHVRAGTQCYHKGGTIHGVARILVHPNFNGNDYNYDVALVELTERIEFDAKRRAIALPKNDTSVKDGTDLDIVGWGSRMLMGTMSERLQRGKVPKINVDRCRTMLDPEPVTNQMFCIFSSGHGPCVGDSGSPAVLNGTLIGIASWSPSCAYIYPTVYVDVTAVANWVIEAIGKQRESS